jgi:hypothetical protein
MSKKAVTWMDVIREQLAKMRKEGKTPSIGDVTPYAKKEWAEIKAGKHPLYSQGSSKGKSKGKSSKKDKSTGKMSKKMMKTQKLQKNKQFSQSSNKIAIEQMLSKVHLCKKDIIKIQKYLKTQQGGSCGCEQTGGGCGCEKTGGGKGKGKKTRKNKNKNMNKKMKGGEVDFPGKDGLEELDEETDGTQLDMKYVEEV